MPEDSAAPDLRFLPLGDPDYPERLLDLKKPPPFVYIRGALRRIPLQSVAVVGTRQPTEDGLRRASRIARALTSAGYTVLSGLARGIDTAAHRAALPNTVAVVGTGLLQCYPAENAALYEQILETGAALSQFTPEAPPKRRHFPMRNAIMSALSLGSVVVEAGEHSGTRIQVRAALGQGRRVFLLRSLVESQEWARDLQDRCTVVETEDDLLGGLA